MTRYPGNQVKPRDYSVTFTCRDLYTPSGMPERRQEKVQGLSQLDAEVHLSQRLHKQLKSLHFILDMTEHPQ